MIVSKTPEKIMESIKATYSVNPSVLQMTTRKIEKVSGTLDVKSILSKPSNK
jgi:hypothetical protein